MSEVATFMACGCVSPSFKVHAQAIGDGMNAELTGVEPWCFVHNTGKLWSGPLPDLTGRWATCLECGHHAQPSSVQLYHFRYQPEEATDLFWCLNCAFGDERNVDDPGDYERPDQGEGE